MLEMVWSGKLTATVQLVKSGRTVGLVDCDVYDEKQSLVARVYVHDPSRRTGAGSLAPS